MTIQLTAVLDIELARTADFESALTVLAEIAAAEIGVLAYDFWRDPVRPGRYLLRERYVDQSAVDAHMAIPEVVAFVGRLPEWLAADSQGIIESATELTRMPLSRNRAGAR